MPKMRNLWRSIRLRKWLRNGLLALVVVLAVVIAPLGGVVIRCRPFTEVAPAATSNTNTIDWGEHARGEDQSYLTLPEWYIVFYSDEYATFLQHAPPSNFPYLGSIVQFWRAYYRTCDQIAGRYPFNSEYQLTLAVIGVSFTLENLLRGAYESTIGRLAEWASSEEMTAEDAYARAVAQEYGDFIHTIPWYEFPFGEKLRGLWRTTDWLGPNLIRKWERKFALSFEYGGKMVYGFLLRQGAGAAFSTVLLETRAHVEGLSPALLAEESELRMIAEFDDGSALVGIPRYEAFTQMVPRLAAQGARFVAIAGNDEILITILAPRDWSYDLATGHFLFAMPILSQPAMQRIAVKVPVPSLHLVLGELDAHKVRLEHLYDY